MATMALPQEAPTHILSSELDRSDAILSVDFSAVIKEALRFASLGSFEVRLRCPDGRKRTVKQLVKQFNRDYDGRACFSF